MESETVKMEYESQPSTYEEAIAVLQEIPLFTTKNSLENTRRLLALLGCPQERFRIIHVAGTNGKGSCCAFLERIFRENGLKTGLFTSPHLVRTNERFRVLGEEIPDGAFLEAFWRVQEAVRRLVLEGGKQPTYFELLFALGLCWFEKEKIDLLICETGLGGRLDATSAIDKVDAAVITSISLDHMKYLGDTVSGIAYEKAGIIRKDTPVIYLAKDPESAGVIAQCAADLGAKQIPLKKDAYVITRREKGAICVRLDLSAGDVLEFRVLSEAMYQAENASLAAVCAVFLGVEPEIIKAGIEKTRWEGRMQEIRRDVFLDGAHNPDGVRSLACEIRRISKTRKVWLLCAIVADKNHDGMIRELCRDVTYEGVIVTSAGGSRKLDTEVLLDEFRCLGVQCVEQESDAKKAYEKALVQKGEGVLFCAGSLYLIGEILAFERSQERC